MLTPGTYLQNRYEILERIGSGGMSVVYKARCHNLDRLVAIKVLKEEFAFDENFVSKFKMEAQSAARLSHPNIVSVYDVVDEDVYHYIVMELIECKMCIRDSAGTGGFCSPCTEPGPAEVPVPGQGGPFLYHPGCGRNTGIPDTD